MAAWHLWLALPPLAVACAQDLRARLIPDWTGLALAALGLLGAAAAGTLPASIAGGAGCLAFGTAAAWCGLWGGGDAKLFGASGLLVGAGQVVPMVTIMAVTGAGLALIAMAARPVARAIPARTVARWPRIVRNELRRVRVAPSVPYALAIAGGVMGACVV